MTSASTVDDTVFLMGERTLAPAQGELIGTPELPPKGAQRDDSIY